LWYAGFELTPAQWSFGFRYVGFSGDTCTVELRSPERRCDASSAGIDSTEWPSTQVMMSPSSRPLLSADECSMKPVIASLSLMYIFVVIISQFILTCVTILLLLRGRVLNEAGDRDHRGVW
jgi:hypothetical protein